MAGAIPVGMAEIKTSSNPTDVLSAMGLGSCIGVCVYDPTTRIGGMAHVMLPESRAARGAANESAGKFADTAVPALLERLEKAGAKRRSLRVAIGGGAQVFSFGASSPVLAIGERNTEAVMNALKAAGLAPVATHTGGTTGRTVTLEIGTGLVQVRMVGGQPQELAKLRG